MSRRVVAAALAGALALALTGCGGGGDEDDGDDGRGSTPAPTSTAPESASATPTADPAAYLPVPEGRTLTEPGTDLPFREAALVAWKPRQDVVGVVGVRVLRVEVTSVEKSLAGYQLEASAAASTPYFVTLEVGNGGTTDLGGRQLPVYVTDSADRLIAPTGIDNGFEPCPGSTLPPVFAPDDRARSCLIFLVPQGAELEQVMFRPPEGVVPITWTGKVQRLEDRGGPARGPKKGGKGGKGGKGQTQG